MEYKTEILQIKRWFKHSVLKSRISVSWTEDRIVKEFRRGHMVVWGKRCGLQIGVGEGILKKKWMLIE